MIALQYSNVGGIMDFLIVTELKDTDAIVVKLALEHSGHNVRLFYSAEQPTKQTNSFFVENQNYQWNSSDQSGRYLNSDYDVVWWRRTPKPTVPKTSLHPEDYQFVVRENLIFYESIFSNITPNSWWINPKEAAIRVESKLLQLRVAAACGMTIPKTLCSNDPADIRVFTKKHEKIGVIYKPLSPNSWREMGQTKMSYTSKITLNKLANDRLLQLSPGIFQTEIRKKYELRILCMGDYILAMKLNSQEHPEGMIDWRAIPTQKLVMEPYFLPKEIENKIKLFMLKVGIVFGSFDFIVTPDNEYVFLEVNEQGQFLWIEESNPEMHVLDMFVNYMVNRSVEFAWNKQKSIHTIDKYREQTSQISSLEYDSIC